MRGRTDPVTEISVTGMKILRYEHSSPVTGRKIFDKIASRSPDSGQKGIILVLYVFPFQEYAKYLY